MLTHIANQFLLLEILSKRRGEYTCIWWYLCDFLQPWIPLENSYSYIQISHSSVSLDVHLQSSLKPSRSKWSTRERCWCMTCCQRGTCLRKWWRIVSNSRKRDRFSNNNSMKRRNNRICYKWDSRGKGNHFQVDRSFDGCLLILKHVSL